MPPSMKPKLLAGLTTASQATSRIEPRWMVTKARSPQKRSQASASGGSTAASTRRRLVIRRGVRLLGDLPHEAARLVIADRQVRHLQAAPAGLALSQGEVPCGADDLAHTRVAKQVRMRRRRLPGRRAGRRAAPGRAR